MGQSDQLARAALEMAGYYGWRIIPLLPNTKKPFFNAWQQMATDDEETVAQWWEQNPHYNIGVAMGQGSGIVDIECDSDEAEAMLYDLFGGSVPETPTYQSNRGKHRLFQWTVDLPLPDKAVFKIGRSRHGLEIQTAGPLEIRTGNGGKGCQSAFPPSINPDSGRPNVWLISPSACDVAEIPDRVIAQLAHMATEGNGVAGRGRSSDEWEQIAQSGVDEGGRNNTAAAYIGRKLADLKNSHDSGAVARCWIEIRDWNEARCRPPLPEQELRTTFKSILSRHQKQEIERQFQAEIEPHRDPGPDGTGSQAEWRLVRVNSEPVKWKLYSPLWETKAEGGCLVLSSFELQSAARITTKAIEAGVWLDGWFKSLWHGKKGDPESGLAQRLMDTYESEDASPEEIRTNVVACHVWEAISCPREDVEPDDKGRPTLLPDKRVAFKFPVLLGMLQHNVDPPKHGELLGLFRRLNLSSSELLHVGKSRSRFHVMQPEQVAALESFVSGVRDA